MTPIRKCLFDVNFNSCLTVESNTLTNGWRLPTEEENLHLYPFICLPSPSKDPQMVHLYQLYAAEFLFFSMYLLKRLSHSMLILPMYWGT